MTSRPHRESVAIIGAGPAGLTAGYLLAKEGVDVTVLEADPEYVGGISRTVRHRSDAAGGACFRFDIGGHRFFSKSDAVNALWTEILADEMLERPRSSRILYRGKYYAYPLNAVEALRNLGPLETARCIASYAKARLFPVRSPRSFEDWVCNEFGRRLYGIFFKTYTEKVWGMPCTEISADWAAQRIKGLSLSKAIWNALSPRRGRSPRGSEIKSLIGSFRYPRLGPGMMWEAAARRIEELGGSVRLGCRVTGLERVPACDHRSSGGWRVDYVGGDGSRGCVEAAHVVSSAPLGELARSLAPPVPTEVAAAAGRLGYRDFITVALIARTGRRLEDNWIYVHEPGVRVGRIQNFASWSPDLVPEPTMACYGLEYFCFEGDGLWTSSDADLLALARRELAELGIVADGEVVDGCVVRQKKAYPVYDDAYARHVATIREALERDCPNLHIVGRNGMHKYNNQDHAMMTAMLVVRNILAGRRLHDPWRVNEDAEYHEAGGEALPQVADPAGSGASGIRQVPMRVS